MEYRLSSSLTQANSIPTNKILASQVGLMEATVFGELCGESDYWHEHNGITEDGYFFSTVENIESKLFIKRDVQQKIIKKLVNSGLISVKKKGCPAKRYIKINEEELANKLGVLPSTSWRKNRQLDNGNSATKDTIYKDTILKNKEKEIYKEKEREQLEEEFERFWKLYPKKVAKGKARDSYLKALTKTTSDVILKGVENYLKEIERKNTEDHYIKHPTTWLNQECWEDEYDFECNQKNDSSSPSRSAKPQDDYVHYNEIGVELDDFLKEKGLTENEFISKINEWRESVYKETGKFIYDNPPDEIIQKILNGEM